MRLSARLGRCCRLCLRLRLLGSQLMGAQTLVCHLAPVKGGGTDVGNAADCLLCCQSFPRCTGFGIEIHTVGAVVLLCRRGRSRLVGAAVSIADCYVRCLQHYNSKFEIPLAAAAAVAAAAVSPQRCRHPGRVRPTPGRAEASRQLQQLLEGAWARLAPARGGRCSATQHTRCRRSRAVSQSGSAGSGI